MKVFECKKCGHCCEGVGGIVLTAIDIERICNFLDMKKEAVLTFFSEERGGKRHLLINESGTCVFFKKDAGCAIHAAKPDVCRAWPFFRGNLVDEISLQMAKEFCPGINPASSFKEFRAFAKDYINNNNLSHPEKHSPNALNFSDL